MSLYTDLDNKQHDPPRWLVGDPTSKTKLDKIRNAQAFTKNVKAVDLPGTCSTAIPAVVAESGGDIHVWTHLEWNSTDGPVEKTLVTVSRLGNVSSPDTFTLLRRMIYIKGCWYATASTLTSITTYMTGKYTAGEPDDPSNDYKVFGSGDGGVPKKVAWYSGSTGSDGTDNYKGVIAPLGGDDSFTFWVNSDGDLKGKYEYVGAPGPDEYFASIYLKIIFGPRMY